MSKLIFLEFNEINFDFLEEYALKHPFPNFQRFFDAHGLCKTTSEHDFKKLEPWIQWVTAHTGLDADSHGVFRLGDIVNTTVPQIWEKLEAEKNLSVAAISPMNARNATSNAAFFIPDPWTKTRVDGSWALRQLSRSVNQLVNENARGLMTLGAMAGLLVGAASNFRATSTGTYASLLAGARRKKWLKALILDRLLADTLITQWRKHQPDFTTLFLNAGAHIQHHYMYESACYTGSQKADNNIPPGSDPLLDVYKMYDRILGDVQKAAPQARIMFGTGLSQLPNPKLIHYYRPNDHKSLLKRLGIDFKDVLPRMSRDFLIVCSSEEAGKRVQSQLEAVTADNGNPIFSIDNRGAELFCMLCYTDKIESGIKVKFDGGEILDFDQCVTLVTIENGIHRSTGFFSDSGTSKDDLPAGIELKQVFSRVIAAFDNQSGESHSQLAYES